MRGTEMARRFLAGLSVLWVLAIGPYLAAIVSDPRMDGSALVFLLRVAVLPAAAPWLLFAGLSPLVRRAGWAGPMRRGPGQA